MYILALLVSLIMAATVGYFSVVGLMTIYATIPFTIMIAGIVIELAKVLTVSLLYQFWDVAIARVKALAFVVILGTMVMTSTGVYGYLTKGYLDQVSPMEGIETRIENYDIQINSLKTRIEQNQAQITIMDEAMKKYTELGAISKGLSKMDERQDRYDALLDSNQKLRDDILNIEQEKLSLRTEQQKINNEIGAISFISSLFGVTDTKVTMVYFTLFLVILLDPVAIFLLWFANFAHANQNHENKRKDLKSGMFQKPNMPYQQVSDVPQDIRNQLETFLDEQDDPSAEEIKEYYENSAVKTAMSNTDANKPVEESKAKPNNKDHWLRSTKT